jgi:aminomuconate-semialdehyde/2-hydroxymuconate-6-semialdehyde dehydrogenase
MIVGDPQDEKTQIGALVSLQHMEKVLNYVDIAKQEGGIVLCGGKRVMVNGWVDL